MTFRHQNIWEKRGFFFNIFHLLVTVCEYVTLSWITLIICSLSYAKMGSMKDRNGMDLTTGEDIKKRWQENTELLKKKKDLNDTDNHDDVVNHIEPDILECKDKWTLGSITMNKASGGDRIPIELFQILKDYAVNMLHSICQQWP